MTLYRDLMQRRPVFRTEDLSIADDTVDALSSA